MSALYDRAAAILTCAKTALGDACPERAFVTVGPAVHDFTIDEDGNCASQLTVSMVAVDMRQETRNRCYVALRPTYRLELSRCVTAIEEDTRVPSAPLLDSEAQTLYSDAVALLDGILGAWKSPTAPLFPGRECSEVSFGPLRPVGPSGGSAGWSWDITLDPL